MGIQIVERNETYRLIRDDIGRWAVVEARCGHVYSLHGHDRRAAPETPEGIQCVLGCDGWCDEDRARRAFQMAVRGEHFYSQVIW